MEKFDAGRALEHIEELASWRRLPGTPGEHDARSYLLEVGRSAGMDMRSETFKYTTAPLVIVLPLICLGLALLSIGGSVAFYLGSAPAMIVLGVLMLGGLYFSFKWSATFETFAARDGAMESANIVGEVGGLRPAGTVVIGAHYDSKSQLMPVSLRIGLYGLGYVSAILFALTLLVVGCAQASGTNASGGAAGFWVSLIPAVCLLALSVNVTGNASPGALDDAAGIAVVLELARIIKQEPLENLDLVVACLGCEEVGLVGSIKFMRAHGPAFTERGKLYFLNFDMPFSPAGSVYLNTAFEVPRRRTSATLNGIAKEAADSLGVDVKGVYVPIGAAADHMPWVKNGYEATGFVSPAAFVHSSRDTLEKISGKGLKSAGEIALLTLRRLDQSCEGLPRFK